MKHLFCLLLLLSSSVSLFAQEDTTKTTKRKHVEHFVPHASDTYKPMKLSLSKDGYQYLRFLTWHQIWLTAQQNDGKLDVYQRIRRARVLMAMQMSPRFLMVTHWGLNNLNADNMDGLGRGRGAQIFMHDAWGEYTVVHKKLYIGAGLHYWNGISRLTNSTTLSTVTLDGPLFNWPTVNRTDQFARHLGVYAKGELGRFRYQFSVNEPISQNEAYNEEIDVDVALQEGNPIYKTKQVYGGDKADIAYQGYFSYQFLDTESHKYPYTVGTYMGKKKVFNLGAGFFSHPEGTLSLDNGDTVTHDVLLLGVDAYYDTPIGANGSALSSYLVYYNYDFGPNYAGGASSTSQTVATGQILYGHVGYLLPKFSEKIKLMPYMSYAHKDFDRYDNVASTIGLGTNIFISDHHAKLTLEWLNSKSATTEKRTHQIRLQGMVFL